MVEHIDEDHVLEGVFREYPDVAFRWITTRLAMSSAVTLLNARKIGFVYATKFAIYLSRGWPSCDE
jgi:hypothetical protein